jgi:hypothetical protein
MRIAALVILTLSQFTIVPFMTMVSTDTVRADTSPAVRTAGANVTVIYKTMAR